MKTNKNCHRIFTFGVANIGSLVVGTDVAPDAIWQPGIYSVVGSRSDGIGTSVVILENYVVE